LLDQRIQLHGHFRRVVSAGAVAPPPVDARNPVPECRRVTLQLREEGAHRGHTVLAGMIGVAVIGRGFGAAVHAPAWELAGARVVAVVGREDWRDAVADESVDVVSVVTPPAAHAEVALAVLGAGKA